MLKKIFAFIICFGMTIFILFSLSTTPVLAHPGRTDSSGGHHDYNNASGLGNYHYHHGNPAHLHKDGLCPYKSNNTTKNHVDNSSKDSSTTLLFLSIASFVVIVIVFHKTDKHNSKK